MCRSHAVRLRFCSSLLSTTECTPVIRLSKAAQGKRVQTPLMIIAGGDGGHCGTNTQAPARAPAPGAASLPLQAQQAPRMPPEMTSAAMQRRPGDGVRAQERAGEVNTKSVPAGRLVLRGQHDLFAHVHKMSIGTGRQWCDTSSVVSCYAQLLHYDAALRCIAAAHRSKPQDAHVPQGPKRCLAQSTLLNAPLEGPQLSLEHTQDGTVMRVRSYSLQAGWLCLVSLTLRDNKLSYCKSHGVGSICGSVLSLQGQRLRQLMR